MIVDEVRGEGPGGGGGSPRWQTVMTGLRRRVATLKPRTPARVIALGFATVIGLSTLLLMLPVSAAGDEGAPFVTALFTATSAVCVTGLVVVDTGTYWSGFGQGVLLGSFQLGGFGIMTSASLLGLVVSRRLGLRTRLLAQSETHALGVTDVRRVVSGVVKVSLAFEGVVALVLVSRFALTYHESWWRALYDGVFHSVSAFNSAGFALRNDSLSDFAGDPWVLVPVAVAVFCGGLGFPVLFELRRELRRPEGWSLHTKITVWTSLGLLGVGVVALTAFEWTNPRTLGPLNVGDKLLNGFFAGTMPRSGGFNSVDTGAMEETSWLSSTSSCSSGAAAGAPRAASRSPRSWCSSSRSSPRPRATGTSTCRAAGCRTRCCASPWPWRCSASPRS